jgi:1-acyl-sn-glycerol-3-phosphate acyltransferase
MGLFNRSSSLTMQVPDRSTTVNSRISPWLSAIAYSLGSRLLLPAFFGQIHVTGQEHVPQSGPVILAPMHRSRWDALVVPHVTGPNLTGRYLRFMVTSDEVKGIQGWLIRRLGGFPVDPRRPGISSLRYGVELLQQGEMLVIFPEGGIFRDRTIHPLKQGLARLAIQAEGNPPELGIKILPIQIEYSRELPRWGDSVTVRIGEALSVADFVTGSAKQDAKNLTQELRKRLANPECPSAQTPTELFYNDQTNDSTPLASHSISNYQRELAQP